MNQLATLSNDKEIQFILGPCQIESYNHALFLTSEIKKICDRLNVKFIFKASFDKANRTSINGKRGLGMEEGLTALYGCKHGHGVPVLTDIHEPWQAEKVAEVVDVIQIPALLSRQTDLLVAAGKTGKIVNVKKGQFMSPFDMKHVVDKIKSTGNDNIWLTERGTFFGYNNLVNDMRGLVQMRESDCPIIFDATHSVQSPSGKGDSSGGDRNMVPHLARAATAVGIAGLFMEVHDDPDNAASDGPNSVRLDNLEGILESIIRIDKAVK
jgi:2-dehydro-3-deoxyphosphooctonate aldolase (KDO 8-P synthase)